MTAYSFKPFRHSSHAVILGMLDKDRHPLRILDAGAASGYLGGALRDKKHHVAGIERDKAMSDQAAPLYDEFLQADLETYRFTQRDLFDCVIFADVLEHLREPQEVLRRCLPSLKAGGRIIVSVPNIANVLMRLSLLTGRFEYAEKGTLDRGHLRFYTRRSLLRMLREVPCAIEEVVPTPLPFQLVLPFTQKAMFRPFHAIVHGLTRLWPTMLAYQFVVRARKL